MSQTAVTNAELRQAMEKLSAALYMTKSSINAQADGMIVAGAFSIVAGCAAIGGAGAEAGAISGEMSASAEVDAMPTVEEGAEPATQATGDLAPAEEGTTTEPSTGSTDIPQNTEEEGLEREEQATGTESSGSHEEGSEMRMEERAETRTEETRTEDTREDAETANTQKNATVEVQNSERGMTAEQKTAAKEKISKEAQQKIARARGFQQAGMAIPQAVGSLGQSQYKQKEATEQSGAAVRQTEQQAINTSSQVAQKFYGDLQQGVTAAGQTMDLINQTVVASSRI